MPDEPMTKKERREQAKLARQKEFRRRKRAKRLRAGAISVAAALALGALVFAISQGGSGGVAFAGDLRVGGHLQSLTLPELEGHGLVRYSSYRNEPLVLNFFASWCPNCIHEMPGFQQVHQQLGNKVAFLGVSQSDSPGASISLARQTGIRYQTAIDEHGRFFAAIGGQGMPTTMFIRPGGEIAYIQVGALDPVQLTTDITKYLGVHA